MAPTVTFGFLHTAVDIATEVIDRIHTTAGSHSRVACALRSWATRAGWLTLYAALRAARISSCCPSCPTISRRSPRSRKPCQGGQELFDFGRGEGAFSVEEAKMKRKEWTAKRAEAGYTTATARIAKQVEELTGAVDPHLRTRPHASAAADPSAYVPACWQPSLAPTRPGWWRTRALRR